MSFLCLFSKQTGQDILHLPAKEVFQGQLNSKSSMDPWYTQTVKTSKGTMHWHVFQLPTNTVSALSRFQPLKGLLKGEGWGSGGKDLLPAGLSPRLRKVFSPSGRGDAVAQLTVLTCSQSRQAADVQASTGCPQNTTMATHSKLSLATYEYTHPAPAQLRGLRYLLPSCAIAKGSPSASPNYPSHHVKHSSLNHQAKSVFNTALHKGRKGRGQRSRSSWWYFLLNIIVLIPCLSSSWIICASSGTWLQLLWNPVAKAELINCRLACCSIQPASHVWAISPAKFVCLLKIIDGFPPAYPSSLPATRKAHIARMLFGTRESNSRSWLLPVCCYRFHKGIG